MMLRLPDTLTILFEDLPVTDIRASRGKHTSCHTEAFSETRTQVAILTVGGDGIFNRHKLDGSPRFRSIMLISE
jgi:hypothetical protein